MPFEGKDFPFGRGHFPFDPFDPFDPFGSGFWDDLLANPSVTVGIHPLHPFGKLQLRVWRSSFSETCHEIWTQQYKC